ncbi:hypothetical protein BDR04DRAFT_1035478 [Suillus decipiens]|nr:hypothetical protein BDR04DRAFT_1035478 [Suillus decipiens]
MDQTLSILATAMLEDSKLPKSFWVDTMSTTAYLTGHSPAAGIKGKTPYKTLFNQKKADPSFFHPFGCPAYALIPKDNRSLLVNAQWISK